MKAKDKTERISAADLIAKHLQRPLQTSKAYRADLLALTRFILDPDKDTVVDLASIEAVVADILKQERGLAQLTLDRYADQMRTDGVPLNTLRRRIASTLSLLNLAHKYDVITWAIAVRLPAAAPVKNTQGPGRKVIEQMFDVCRSREDRKGIRDRALLSLLYYHALRRAEVVSLDLANVDLDKAQAIGIKAKGQIDRVVLGLCDTAAEDLALWIVERGTWPGPLFTSCNPRRNERDPLTPRGVYDVVKELGERVGAKVRPHGIRHTATSEILRLTNGNIIIAQALTRHTNPATLVVYNDANQNQHKRASLILDVGQPVFSPFGVVTDNLC
jgi:integrase